MKLHAQIERWPLITAFHITGYTFHHIEVLLIGLEQEGHIGWGEGAGVYYKADTPQSMLAQIESLRARLEAGVDRERLQRLLPAGGARNALDCALWDLEAKLNARPLWELAGLSPPRSLLTTFTCSADTPERMASAARGHAGARAIKLKLTGDEIDADRIRAVREALPQVWLSIDANQGFTRAFLERLMPLLIETQVSLIEQPFRIGQESLLDGFDSPIAIGADESVQTSADIAALVGRFDTINIKLDKCGGLSEALAMVRTARALGLATMVGNMMGTCLAMAPAFLIGQLCEVVDLDGPVFLREDRTDACRYVDGCIDCEIYPRARPSVPSDGSR